MSTWTLILSAGSSSRFGAVKALARWKDGTLLSRAIKTAKEFSGINTLVVTGAYSDQITPHLAGVSYVFNENWTKGMGTSLQCGIREILHQDASVEFVAILPVDQPFVEACFLNQLLSEARRLERCAFTSGGQFVSPPRDDSKIISRPGGKTARRTGIEIGSQSG